MHLFMANHCQPAKYYRRKNHSDGIILSERHCDRTHYKPSMLIPFQSMVLDLELLIFTTSAQMVLFEED
jgi:hypothetical protein